MIRKITAFDDIELEKLRPRVDCNLVKLKYYFAQTLENTLKLK